MATELFRSTSLLPLEADASAEDFLNAAKAAGDYLRTFATEGEQGIYWRQESGQAPDQAPEAAPQIDFYTGNAGIIVFYLQLAAVTGDTSYLEDALRGGEYIVSELRRTNYAYPITSGFADFEPYRNNESTFYAGGFSGVAFALVELAKATGNRDFDEVAYLLTEKVASLAQPAPAGVLWTGYSGTNHDAGTIHYLLYAARHFDQPAWRELAAQAGRAIIATGVREQSGGVRYQGFKNLLDYIVDDSGAEQFFPGYAYGTAGMSFALARLYEETGEAAFLEAAREGAEYLISIAQPVRAGKLIPYMQPENPEHIFYLGLCHGPVGSARLFYSLGYLADDERYRQFYLDLVRGIIGAGAPEYHSSGYWHTHCQCCGTAGFVNLFLGTWLKTGSEEFLDYATRSGKALLGDATVLEGRAVWYQAFSRIDPDLISADLGYMNGAAGIGVALLQLHSALAGRFITIRLPDDPFDAGAALPTWPTAVKQAGS
ncbi:MAG: hypothetical protein LBP24_02125 [Coriobacteriales bacterium]|jgi:lantibiotic modifying enzyme|nr:hypothetical protein [Coriobacteriales bacterium]